MNQNEVWSYIVLSISLFTTILACGWMLKDSPMWKLLGNFISLNDYEWYYNHISTIFHFVNSIVAYIYTIFKINESVIFNKHNSWILENYWNATQVIFRRTLNQGTIISCTVLIYPTCIQWYCTRVWQYILNLMAIWWKCARNGRK